MISEKSLPGCSIETKHTITIIEWREGLFVRTLRLSEYLELIIRKKEDTGS
jgi:hypothetical protein